jgi:hypothetical protein
MWAQIDKLMEIDKYKNSFNLLVNNALQYGLVALCEEEFGNISVAENTTSVTEQLFDASAEEIIRLLRELVLNAVINKSILCSLFNIKGGEMDTDSILQKKFLDGAFRDTPKYLEYYEIRELAKLKTSGGESR